MSKATRSILLLFTFLSTVTIACAGTGQIFSPAGLPQSGGQGYGPPTTGTGASGTQNFPTPPIPLGEGSLLSFPPSSIPVETKDAQKLVGPESGVTEKSATTPAETGSISSFFQCPSENAVADNATASADSSTKRKPSLVGVAGKVLWHALDNLGLPMFVGKDGDLAPSLRHVGATPLNTEPQRADSQVGANGDAQSIPQKIPTNELEGTEDFSKDDKQIP